jgi:hypothetical protein
MDLENIWQQKGGSDEELNRLLEQGDFSKLSSRLPLKKLKANLLIGIIWAILITIIYVVVFFYFPIWQVRVTLAVLVISNTLILIDSWNLYRQVPGILTPSNSLNEELTLHYNSFQRWWSLQQKLSLFIYPIALIGGFILGGVVASEKRVEELLFNSKMLGILGITLLVMVPLCYLGARWMFNYAYGTHLEEIKATIDELSQK